MGLISVNEAGTCIGLPSQPASGTSEMDSETIETTDTELLTDLANARRFAEQHKDDLRYAARRREWFVWDGKRWIPDETAEV